MSKILLYISLSSLLFAEGVVVPDDYQIHSDKELTYIYSDEYQKILPEIKSYQQEVVNQYEKEFGFELDDTMQVGLASQNNQIANGFSTQIPFNMQLFYGAGASYIDYFCFNSWLKTLIIHETAHNFQLNPKESKASWLSHKVVGNSPVSFLGPFPFFPIPNIFESSFILEGNAVMNESRFDNGGRLYSGYALAEVVSLAKAGKITPELMYNETLEFPYGEKFYIVGGFFQQFLVKKYGVQKVNHYFKLHSKQLFPFFTNSAFKNLFGKSFKILLAEFVEEIKTQHSSFEKTNGKIIATSQSFVPFNSSKDEIFTRLSDVESFPKILQYNKKSKKIEYKDGAWNTGEVFKIKDEYYTQSSSKTSPTKIVMGLFDDDSYLLEGSESKVIQGYMPDGKTVYFDVKKSLETPHIFIGDKFYDTSHSSVHVDSKGNLYYFKQQGEKRTLYKNKKAIFDYQGHYGFGTDVGDKGDIYFIAMSQHGSTAYSYDGSQLHRVASGDDVIDFKLIENSTALVATIDDSGYNYQEVKISPKVAQIKNFGPASVDSSSKISAKAQPFKASTSNLHSKDYHPLTQLKYSSLAQGMGYSSESGFLINLQADFTDPLMQNSLSAILSHNEDRTVGGIGYNNQAHQLEFGGTLYGVAHPDDYIEDDERDHGYSAHLKLPFLATGYWRGSSTLEYSKEYDSIYRKPLTFSINISNNKQFGKSKFPNHLNQLNLFTLQDRDSQTIGGTYRWMHDMAWQSYIGVEGSYLKSDNINENFERGIEINDDWGDLQKDHATITMPTLDEPLYAKEAKVAEISLYKVIDTPLYFFSSPISLQRETIYAKYRRYDIDLIDENRVYNEAILGLESDILLLNKFVLPIQTEVIYNKDSEDDFIFRIMLGIDY